MSSQTQPGGTYGSNLAEQVSVDAMEPGVIGLTPGSSKELSRRELLEAIKYERNYSPLTWFKTPKRQRRAMEPIKRREILRNKIWAIGTSNKYGSYVRELEMEIRELDKKLLEGKQ